MQYPGSKNRLAKHLLPVVLADRKPEQWYVEPFAGGCNMIDKVTGPRIANDSNTYLVALWVALQNGWVPPRNVSKKEYYTIKATPQKYAPALVAFVALPCSFGGKWWGGFVSNKAGRNYADVAVRSFLKQIPQLLGVVFTALDYREMVIPSKSILYCDPPYTSVRGLYRGEFDNATFWSWCREKRTEGHQVFISEYEAPADFALLLEVNHPTFMGSSHGSRRTERLYTYQP